MQQESKLKAGKTFKKYAKSLRSCIFLPAEGLQSVLHAVRVRGLEPVAQRLPGVRPVIRRQRRPDLLGPGRVLVNLRPFAAVFVQYFAVLVKEHVFCERTGSFHVQLRLHFNWFPQETSLHS